jgi:hypothetical protein
VKNVWALLIMPGVVGKKRVRRSKEAINNTSRITKELEEVKKP